MKKTLLYLLCIPFLGFAQNPSDLLITEITDPQNSSTAGRYVEIYNGMENTVDLSKYSIKIYKNNSSGTIYELDLDNESGGSYNSGNLA